MFALFRSPVETSGKAAMDEHEHADAVAPPADGEMRWYVLKVQSNREDSIRDGLQRVRTRLGGSGASRRATAKKISASRI